MMDDGRWTKYFTLPVTEAEKRVWLPPERVPIDVWMETRYRLPGKTSDVTGLYSFEYTPWFREPMQRLSEPPVKVGIEACTQCGKSTLMVGVFGYLVDQDPGPTLFTMPRQDDAERRVNTRIKPMFEANSDLLSHVPGGDVRNINIGKETVLDTMIAFLAWSTSPAALADNPICNALTDEPGKFTEIAKTGENPFDLIDERLRTFWMRSRSFYATSPQDEGDLADVQFRSGSDERWYVPCHDCGRWHRIAATEETLILEKDKDGHLFEPDAYKEGAADCWYQCPYCRCRWEEIRRARAVAAGVWVPKTCTMDPNGKRHGTPPATRHFTYSVNSMMLHPRFWQVRREAAKFAAAIHEKNAGSLAGLRNYIRNQTAEPWKEVAKTIAPDVLSRRVLDTLGPRCVPTEARMLVAAGDYHEDVDGNVRIDFEVRAFGTDLVNWVVLAGSVGSFEDLEAALFGPFPWADDGHDAEDLAVATCFIDSGYKPDVIYSWCAKYPGWAWPVKGVETQRTPLVLSDLEKVLQRRRDRVQTARARAYRGQQLVLVDQSYFSEMVTSWIEPTEQTAGSTWFYNRIGDDTHGAYFKEFGGMHRVQVPRAGRKVWTWRAKTPSTPVHFHDTGRYAAAAAWFNKIHLLRTAADTDAVPEAIRRRVEASKQQQHRTERIQRETQRAIRTRY